MKLNLILCGLLVCFSLAAQYPTLSQESEVSLITIGPGPNLVDCFGHSAFRVQDPALNMDRAYNYGVYDSDEDQFIMKFVTGSADYMVDARPFDQFFRSYKAQNRWVTEQVLNLTLEEKQAIFEYLENNSLPQNKYYRYDQFYDNCATKLRDIPKEVLGDKLVFSGAHIKGKVTLRDLVDENAYNHPWWDLGIDIALGNLIDRASTVEGLMYQPDYVLSAYAHATIEREGQSVPAIKATNQLFTSDFHEKPKEVLSPTLTLSVVALIFMIFTVRDYMTKRRSRWIDFVLFFVTGLVGLMLVLLWVATHHTTTVNNLNILWAFAPNLVVAFLLLKAKPKPWLMVYVRFLVILLIAMTMVWITRLQVYNTAMIPLMLMLGFRYVFLWQKGLGGTRKRAF
ncbi:DUF4105 domain-containing protein [Roseivirga sp. UBA838]|uniref:Lnb N-terminal periplasmic domain-containing protein n=1 Tax=Roseivirga sp. UBA838 TaxID=1947393 RepID=UPI00257B506F|nr:DUF4105 domain-containing protein [Roseivirga sp. UBA838]|tara:strand:- start:10171 stop:11361 length:1191 start_codon:yes stop_codon:yes gene_type:complete